MTDGARPDSMFSVRGKVVLLTGSGRGIGRGIARVLADAGARVAINAATDRAAGPLVDSITQQGGEALLVAADLTQPGAADEIVRRTVEHFGGLDVLVNALGDSIKRPVVGNDDTLGMSDADWQNILDINLNHLFTCSRAAGALMLRQGHGRVINIASFMAVRGGAQSVAYTAAKSAIPGFTRALALEWAPVVQVNAISPGQFPDDEALMPAELDARDAEARERFPLQRMGRPREIGYLVQYLASDASAYMTGQTMQLDGGMTL
jgi:NAD(P)-dependent dehydrogenase (short-subunit alcohol dehydrogenase family)